MTLWRHHVLHNTKCVFLFLQSGSVGVRFCLCSKPLPLFGSHKSSTAVSTEPRSSVCWEEIHLLNESRVILFLYNYVTIRDTETSVCFRRTGSIILRSHETVLWDFGMILTCKDICPVSCLPIASQFGSHPSFWIEATKMFIILREIE